MIIGVPREVKVHEYRVGLVPALIRELTTSGHQVLVENDAGIGIGVPNSEYQTAGARMVASPREIFNQSELVVKVKEPQADECKMLREGQALFTFLHLAADPSQADLLLKSKCIAIAYETVTDEQGRLPLLAPMSAVAGRLAVQVGAHCLEKPQGGFGVLLSGLPGSDPSQVVVIGGGIVGTNAIQVALGMGAKVVVFDTSQDRLSALAKQFGPSLTIKNPAETPLIEYLQRAVLVVGAVLIPGDRAPELITKDMLQQMRPGAVLVDVAIDQGGCFKTSRPTTHQNPTYVLDGIVHYCVTNMPGAVPRTSTLALNHATARFVKDIANLGVWKALQSNIHLQRGLNLCSGYVTHQAIARVLGKPYVDPIQLLTEKNHE